MSVALFREMFEQMVVPKNADLIEHYYHPDFIMYSDGLIVVIAAYRDGRIHRVWETIWPSWRSVDAFVSY